MIRNPIAITIAILADGKQTYFTRTKQRSVADRMNKAKNILWINLSEAVKAEKGSD